MLLFLYSHGLHQRFNLQRSLKNDTFLFLFSWFWSPVGVYMDAYTIWRSWWSWRPIRILWVLLNVCLHMLLDSPRQVLENIWTTPVFDHLTSHVVMIRPTVVIVFCRVLTAHDVEDDHEQNEDLLNWSHGLRVANSWRQDETFFKRKRSKFEMCIQDLRPPFSWILGDLIIE